MLARHYGPPSELLAGKKPKTKPTFLFSTHQLSRGEISVFFFFSDISGNRIIKRDWPKTKKRDESSLAKNVLFPFVR
jgi:hypothetical protein